MKTGHGFGECRLFTFRGEYCGKSFNRCHCSLSPDAKGGIYPFPMTLFFQVLGSLGVFLFGMKVMSEGIQRAAGQRMRAVMSSMTRNRFYSILTGLFITSLIQSSSATTVMVVSFVNAQLLTLFEAIGVILGANLGTTLTFWIISVFGFKFSLSSIALPVIGIGLPLLFIKRGKLNEWGEVVIGFGLLFLGLMFLKDSVPDIRSHPEVLEFVKNYSGHGMYSVLMFIGIGLVLTIVVQSSSVAGAITITLAYKGWIDYHSAAAIVLGENIGTTITANLAAIGGTTAAKRAARAHTLFNVIGVIWMLVVFIPFADMINRIVPGDASQPEHIAINLAAFHSLFNLMNICLLVGFIPQLVRIVTRLVPDEVKTGRAVRLEYFSTPLTKTGELNLAEAERAVSRMSELTIEMFQGFTEVFANPNANVKQKIAELKSYEEASDAMAHDITSYLILCSTDQISPASAPRVAALIRTVAELEEICDGCYRLVIQVERKIRKERDFSAASQIKVSEFAAQVLAFLQFSHSHLGREPSNEAMDTAHRLENEIDARRKSLRRDAVKRMQETNQVKIEMIFLDLISEIETIGNHGLNILQAIRR
jgi:phosphate:Na+ symporter